MPNVPFTGLSVPVYIIAGLMALSLALLRKIARTYRELRSVPSKRAYW